jgi:hypothetical protein
MPKHIITAQINHNTVVIRVERFFKLMLLEKAPVKYPSV